MTTSEPMAPDFLGQLEYVGDSPSLSRSHYHSFIAGVMRALHSEIPPISPVDLAQPARIDIRKEYFRGQAVNRAVIFLLSSGCEWALRSAHGCTMCGHIAKQARTSEPFPPEHFIRQFTAAFTALDFRNMPVLNIFNNGSFLNDNEIPPEAREAILDLVSRNQSIKKLLIECRPEFVNEAAIQRAKGILKDTELEIAIGLETADDFRRLVAINKGFTLHDFTRAAEVVKRNEIGLRSYILVKPPFSSEYEGIEDAVSSIATAFSLGVDTVSLEGMTVQKYTLVEYLYRRGYYKLPWLWSIVEIVRRTAHLGKVVIGLFDFYPSPELVPTNCDLCNKVVAAAMVRYNNTLDVGAFEHLDCACREDWERILTDRRNMRQLLRAFAESTKDEQWTTMSSGAGGD